MEEKTKKSKISIILFIITSVFFAMPSVLYLIQNKTIYRFVYVWTYLFRIPSTSMEKMTNAILFFILFIK